MSKHDDLNFFKAIHNEWTTAVNKAYSEHGVFWAFNDEQFKEGINRVSMKGLLAPGEKVMRMSGGGFIPVNQSDKLTLATDKLHQIFLNAIAELELERAEVVYHLNNYECLYTASIAWTDIRDAMGGNRFNRDFVQKVFDEEIERYY